MIKKNVQLPVTSGYYIHKEIHTSTLNEYISLARESQKTQWNPLRKNGVIYQVEYGKRASQMNFTELEYHSQYRMDVTHTTIKMSCPTTQLPAFLFCGLHVQPNGVQGLRKHHHLRLDPKLGHVTFAIRRILCSCVSCNNMLDKPWDPGVFQG